MSISETIRLLIADDHELFRRGLKIFIDTQPDLELVAEASNGAEAIALCEAHQPDVVLMDIMMPGTNGVQAAKQIGEHWPDIYVIALTSFEDEKTVPQMLQAGAAGYLLKDISSAELAQSVRDVFHGEAIMSPKATQMLVSALRHEQETDYQLTEREHDVLQLLVDGLTNKEIGMRLHISRSTVKNHISHILKKMDVASRSEAAVLAVRENLLD